jgi:hypothetical protein
MTERRAQICVRCEFEFIQSTNPATGIHRKLCAAPGQDSTWWLVMDPAFMEGPDSTCLKGKWAEGRMQDAERRPVLRSPPAASEGEEGAQNAERKDLRGCAPCKERMISEMQSAIGNQKSDFRNPISVVIASLNEKENLVATVASVKGDCPEAEIIVVDDASTLPEPVFAIRNPRRIGGPRSRRLGALRAGGEVLIFLDAHNALDWESACWFAKRYPEIGPIRPEFKEALDRPHKLRTLAAAAIEHRAIVYGGCMFSCGRAGACLVPENGLIGGRWMQRRPDLPKLELWPTSLLMGAFYAIPRTILDEFGGWPALPNWHGSQELAVALLAAAHQVPILFHQGVALWHLFRGKKTGVNPPFAMPEWGAQLGYAAAWRLVLDDAHWKDYRARLQAGQGPHGKVPEHILAQVEKEEFNRYRADVQSRFKLGSDELLAELERRMNADREARVQGAEDKVLNQGKKILLAITMSADSGTNSNAATLEEKRKILGRCLESARVSGADEIVLCAIGDGPKLRGWPELAGIHVVSVGANPGLPVGERRAVRAAIAEARAGGFEWLVKVGADVFHPCPDWAKELVRRGMAAPGGAALVAGICNNGCAVTKVFAARPDFLAQTWPEDSEVSSLGAGAVLERIWTAKIERLGLKKLWLPLPCRHVIEAGANWWTPTDAALAYQHSHVIAIAAQWRMKNGE